MATTNLGLKTINQSDNVSPTPINDNMELLDKLGLDYVTAEGVSGIWSYRRWKSGIYECWGRKTVQTPGRTGGGNIGKAGDADVSMSGYASFSENYPVTFSAVPVTNVNVRQAGNFKCTVGYVEHERSSITAYVLFMEENADVELAIHAIGKVSS